MTGHNSGLHVEICQDRRQRVAGADQFSVQQPRDRRGLCDDRVAGPEHIGLRDRHEKIAPDLRKTIVADGDADPAQIDREMPHLAHKQIRGGFGDLFDTAPGAKVLDHERLVGLQMRIKIGGSIGVLDDDHFVGQILVAMGQIEDLRLFVDVVNHASQTRAAATLNIAKSVVSRRLRLLEDRYGTQLIDRRSGIWDVTAAGLELYQRAVRLLSEANEIDTDFTDARLSPAGP